MKKEFQQIVKSALREDRAREDITTNNFVPAGHRSKAHIIAQEPLTICGLEIAREVFRQIDPSVRFQYKAEDGDNIKRNTAVAVVKGKTRSILKAERTALNFLGYLSGISTLTNAYVTKTKGSRSKVYDTRKTTPTLRLLEKYAVRCGGGENHRQNLNEMVLLKDNHLAITNGHIPLKEKISRIRRKHRKLIELEVDTLTQLKAALLANPDIILLDNMTVKQLKQSVLLKKRSRSKILLEASGGISLKNVSQIAQTGVDRISVGALTHSAKAANFSLELSS